MRPKKTTIALLRTIVQGFSQVAPPQMDFFPGLIIYFRKRLPHCSVRSTSVVSMTTAVKMKPRILITSLYRGFEGALVAGSLRIERAASWRWPKLQRVEP